MLHFTEDKKPSIRDINRYTTKYSGNWRPIGIELGLESDVLDIIKTNHPSDCKACYQAMIEKWLKLNGITTWKVLEVALTNVNRQDLGLDPVVDTIDDTIYGMQNMNVQLYINYF